MDSVGILIFRRPPVPEMVSPVFGSFSKMICNVRKSSSVNPKACHLAVNDGTSINVLFSIFNPFLINKIQHICCEVNTFNIL